MATTSSVPTIIDALLEAFATNLPGGVPVFEAWPGAEAKREMVHFGPVTWDDYTIATIKAGRQQRQENYDIEFFVYAAPVAGSSPSNPKATRDRAYTLLAALEDALADDPKPSADNVSIQHVQIRPRDTGVREFEKSWFYGISGSIAVAARLV